MTPLYKYLDDGGDFNDLLECITQTAKKTKASLADVARTMDDRYPGLSFSYDHFADTQELRVQDDQGVRLYDEDGDYTHLDLTNERIEAESSVRYLHINTTGARPGDLIVGVHNIARDAILRIAGGVLPPSKRDLNMIRHFPDLWTIFLNKLATVEFFHSMTISGGFHFLASQSGCYVLYLALSSCCLHMHSLWNRRRVEELRLWPTC